jgi:hypothetical protein
VIVVTMMTLRTAFLAAVLGGCSGGGDPHGPCDVLGGPPTDHAAFGGVEYRVVGGFSGQGDGTSLQVQPDGTMTRHTSQGGAEQGRLDAATVADLVDQARATQFPTLCAMYRCSGCVDQFDDEVTVQFDGRPLTVIASHLGDPLARLKDMISALQQVLDRRLP